jgi:hypothetical protein
MHSQSLDILYPLRLKALLGEDVDEPFGFYNEISICRGNRLLRPVVVM